jgi:uncharacterized protein with PQ loop repeat
MTYRYYKYILPSVFAFCMAFMLLGWTQTFGWVYSLAFALSAIPQALKSIKEKNSAGVADGTLLLWIIGEIAGTIYGISLMQWPIIFNCALNTIFVGIIVWYRLFPKERPVL